MSTRTDIWESPTLAGLLVSRASAEDAGAIAATTFDAAERSDVVIECEQLDADVATAKRALDVARAVRLSARAALLDKLGPGEVEIMPSGRVVFSGRVADGKATVNTRALAEHADELPEHLQPRETVVWPSVSEIRDAATKRLIPRKLMRILIDEPPKVPGLRFRTIADGTEVES